jgi:glycosyltransferase involved in cell wall biosynthesis
VTGVLVPPDDIAAAAEAVPKAARLRRAGCRRHAEACFDLDGSLDAHERLYRRLARAVGTGSPAHA